MNTKYNDVFAFYVNDINCAVVGEGDAAVPVSINTINNGNPLGEKATNPDLYRNNLLVDGTSPINTGMNGLTVVLNCGAAVKPGETNTMKLAIADTGDSSLDSNVFIEAGSLTTIPPTPTPTTEAVPTPTPTKATVDRTNDAGDVHIHTPDGLIYDFQEVGDFLLTQSTSGDVVLQARQASWENNPQVSVNKAVAMNVAGDVLEFYLEPERSFYINDVLTDLPTGNVDLPQGGSITLTGLGNTDFTIYWPDGNTGARVILYGSYLDIGIARLNGSLTYEGVLGNLDGNSQNDLKIRDGNQIQPPPNLAQLRSFGDSWRVPAEDSLFRNAKSPAEEADPAVQPLGLGDLDAETRGQAEEICRAAGVTDSVALRNCIYDVAVTGDESFVESAQVFEEGTKDLPPSAKVPAQPGETLTGNIFDAGQAVRSGISILDGDDLIITSGKLADGTGYIRFNIYRDGEYVASYSVSTDAAVADALTGAAFATMELPAAEEAEAGIAAEDLAMLQESIPVCAEGLMLLAENMYEYPDAADVYADAYQTFAQEYLPGCEAVGSFINTYPEKVGVFFDEVGFSFADFVASDGYSKATWTDTIGTITNIGARVPQYCPNAHLAQYDCVKATERSLISIEAALPALDLLFQFSQ